MNIMQNAPAASSIDALAADYAARTGARAVEPFHFQTSPSPLFPDEEPELEEGSITLRLQGRTREEIIDELMGTAARSPKLVDADAAREAVLRRERLAGSGWHNGVAIPHGRTEAVRDLVAVFGVSEAAVDFQADDGRPCRIFLLSLAPSRRAGAQLSFVARIESRLRDRAVREAVLDARSGREVLKALSIPSAS
jgi:PTS system nitrogen regulatory IIA component